jgi:2',3'-cyclic-nucleotide 2'-phosphodiesterase (5'-nucleotidase family)
MLRKITYFIVTAIMMGLCSMGASAEAEAAESDKGELIAVIYHTGDTEGYLLHNAEEGYIGADYLAAYVNSTRKSTPSTFLFDAGDALQGVFFVNADKGETAVNIMNAVGYAAMALGNHEFDYGFDRLLEMAEAANFPFLTQATIVEDNKILKDSAIIERGGIKIGVFGLTTPAAKYTSTGGIDRDYGTVSELITYAADIAKQLRNDGADIVVCLSHMGIDESGYGTAYDIANNVSGIDIIIDSHVFWDTSGGTNFTAPVTGAGGAGEIGVVRFYRKNGIITPEIAVVNYDEASTVTPDPAVTAVLDSAEEKLQTIAAQVIGYSPVALTDYEKPVIRNQESALANAVADSMIWATGADIAFCNSGNVRAPMSAGDITIGEVNNILPYTNIVLTAQLPGSVIRQALEHSASLYGMDNGGFMQLSGAAYTFDPALPIGARVTDITVNGNPLEDDKLYSLATFDFVSAGGDGYVMLTEYYTGNSTANGDIADIFARYLSQMDEGESLLTKTQGRINILQNTSDGASGGISTILVITIITIFVIVCNVVAAVAVYLKRKGGRL